MTAPELEPLPGPLSGDAPTDRERALLTDVMIDLRQDLAHAPELQRVLLRALRAGYAAGRRSVLDAPARVYRVGDPEPEHRVVLVDGEGNVEHWDPVVDHDWLDVLRCYGTLVQVDVDYAAAVAADDQRRAEL